MTCDVTRAWACHYGSIRVARQEGLRGRLAAVEDGVYTWIGPARERSAAAVLRRYVATADYTGATAAVRLECRLYAASGEEVDSSTMVLPAPAEPPT